MFRKHAWQAVEVILITRMGALAPIVSPLSSTSSPMGVHDPTQYQGLEIRFGECWGNHKLDCILGMNEGWSIPSVKCDYWIGHSTLSLIEWCSNRGY